MQQSQLSNAFYKYKAFDNCKLQLSNALSGALSGSHLFSKNPDHLLILDNHLWICFNQLCCALRYEICFNLNSAFCLKSHQGFLNQLRFCDVLCVMHSACFSVVVLFSLRRWNTISLYTYTPAQKRKLPYAPTQ